VAFGSSLVAAADGALLGGTALGDRSIATGRWAWWSMFFMVLVLFTFTFTFTLMFIFTTIIFTICPSVGEGGSEAEAEEQSKAENGELHG